MLHFISQIHCGLPLIWNSLFCPWKSLMQNLIGKYFIWQLYRPFRPPLVQTSAEKEDVSAAHLIQPSPFIQPDGKPHRVMGSGEMKLVNEKQSKWSCSPLWSLWGCTMLTEAQEKRWQWHPAMATRMGMKLSLLLLKLQNINMVM